MKKIKKAGIATKALTALLVAGLLVSGINVTPKAAVANFSIFTDEGEYVGDLPVEEEYVAGLGLLNEFHTLTQSQYNAVLQLKASAEAAQAQKAAEEAEYQAELERKKAADEEAARQKAIEEEAARQKAIEEEAARQKAIEEEAARQKAIEEEAARQKAIEEEAARQKALEEEAARQAALAAQPVKRSTPNAGKDLLNGHKIVNIPENSAIWYDGKSPEMCAGGEYVFSDQAYNAFANEVRGSLTLNLHVKAIARGADEADSDEQIIRVDIHDFPPLPKVQRATPNAKFEASDSSLSNLECARYSVDGGSTWSSDQVGVVTISNVHPDLEIIVINSARTEDEADSAPQTIWIEKAGKPQSVAGNPPEAIGGKGKIVNVSSDEEYCVSGSNNWIRIDGNSVDVNPGNYDVRIRAHGNLLAGDLVTVNVPEQQGRKADKPNAAFDGARLNLYNISVGCAYSVDGVNWATITDASCTNVTLTREQAERAVHGNGIHVVKKGDGKTTIDSDEQLIALAEAVRPSGISTSPATNGNNGAINNVATDMQYRSENGNWVDIGSNQVTGLAAGKYFVRRRGAGQTIASEEVAVTVDKKSGPVNKQSTPNAEFNAWIMTLSNVNGCKISLDGGNSYSNKIDKNDIVLDESKIKTDKGIKVIRCGDATILDSDPQTISLSKMPVPTGISATSATSKTGGMITGVNSNMEYRAANAGSWTVPNGNTIANLPAGTYYVRTRGQHSAMPSDVLVVSIQLSTTPTVVQPQQSTIVVTPVQNPVKTDPVKQDDNKKDDKKDTKTETKTEEKKEEAVEEKTETETTTEETAAESEIKPVEEASGEPILVSDTSVQGWGAIEGRMSKDSLDPIAVDLTSSSTVVPATTIAAAATTDTELILDVTPTMAWSINPTEITSAKNDIDLGIKENPNDIPREVIAKVETEGTVAKEFTIKHEGDFGFTAHLTIALDAADAGKTAKLYYYNKTTGNMEVIDTAVINNYGEATFALSHASSYAVTVDKLTASNTTDGGQKASVTEKTKEKKSSSNWWIWVVIIAVIITAVGAGVVVYLKQKEDEKRRRRHQAQHNQHRDGENHTNHTPTHKN